MARSVERLLAAAWPLLIKFKWETLLAACEVY